jgi:OmcA/MtrC family decaheme c-type cytochrome
MKLRTILIGCLALAGCGGSAKNCTVTDNGNGSATITCPDGSTTTVTSGKDGTNGQNGQNGQNGDAGSSGVNGTSCTVSTDADAGTKTISCTDGTQVTLHDGTNGVNAGDILNFQLLTDLELQQNDFAVTIQSISKDPKPVVNFTVRNLKGSAMKNIPVANFAGIALLQLVPGDPTPNTGNGQALDTWISHIANCATCQASTETANAATLVDHGDGTYTYTFQKDVVNPTAYDGGMAIAGVAFDANAVHRFALRFARSDNMFRPVDVTYDYVPATGANVDGQNDKVNVSNCLSCHNQWRASPLNVGGTTPFHGGQRYDVRYCVVCHNDQRKYVGTAITGNAIIAEPSIDGFGVMTPPAGQTSIRVLRGEAVINLPVFAHKIHNGDNLTLTGPYAGLGTNINSFAFPQDVRNCTKCHSSAAKADNWKNKPSRRACGACHDKVDFVTGTNHGPMAIAAPNDNTCTLCHTPDVITTEHLAIAPPDPNNTLLTPAANGGTPNTNASWMGNILAPPPGGRVFSYDIASVTTTDGGAGYLFPVVKFRFIENDAGVVFNVADGGNQLLDGFVGSPSVYCVYTVPQDGLATPADFNASASVYLRNIWNGSATGTLAGPDTNGYYTATVMSGKVPTTGTMLTCGLGYTYSLSGTPPLVQTNLPKYPYDAGVGGLSLPAKNAWKVATGFTGRRGATASTSTNGQIVTAAKCNACHNELGISPSYHSGQRNDSATCAFCHNPNRTSSGWTAGSGSFVHAIHAAQIRKVPYNWHAVGATIDEPTVTGFFDVEYPGRLNYCETCHTPGMYDFSNAWYTDANLANRMQQTVATGTYDAVTLAADGGQTAAAIAISPYVVADGGYQYGPGFSYNASSQVTVQPAATTLVISPIANNCFGCHDTSMARAHMVNNGATIYDTRANAALNVEQCMICHGPGSVAAIKDVHYNR